MHRQSNGGGVGVESLSLNGWVVYWPVAMAEGANAHAETTAQWSGTQVCNDYHAALDLITSQ